MIQYVNENTLPSLDCFCQGDPFGCKIASLAQAYGLDTPFAGFWIQTDPKGTVTAVLSKLEGTAVLCAQDCADTTELREFLSMTGAEISLYCPEKLTIPKVQNKKTGWVMKLIVSTDPRKENVFRHSFLMEDNPSLQQVHSLLCSCAKEGFRPPPFAPFYVDMSHRIRHQAARCVGVWEEGRLISCACTVAETNCCAVLGAVATHPDRQGNGLGRAVVSTLTAQLKEEGKEVFLFRGLKENQQFYERLGFINVCRWEEAAF